MFEIERKIFGTNDIEERMMLKDIKHGRKYSSCIYYPEGDERYPGFIKVDPITRETIEHIESAFPEYRERYSRYAKREMLKLRADHDHRSERYFNWIKDPYSDL